MADLDVSAAILAPTGWIELEDPEGGYELHKESFGKRSYSHRKTEVESEWVAGTYTTRSVRANVNEDLAVWVAGATPFETRMRLDALLKGLDQLSYKIRFRNVDVQETWSCFPADYQLECSQELRLARLVLVRATVPRLPAAQIAQVL